MRTATRDAIPPQVAPGRWDVDGPNSALWVSTGIGAHGTVRGRLHRPSGVIGLGPDPAGCTVRVVVDTGTLSCGRPVLDRMLRWSGVVDTARNPWIRFVSVACRPRGDNGDGWLDGILSTPSGAREVTLRLFAPVGLGPDRAGFRAAGELPPGCAEDLLGAPRGLLRTPLALALAVEAVRAQAGPQP